MFTAILATAIAGRVKVTMTEDLYVRRLNVPIPQATINTVAHAITADIPAAQISAFLTTYQKAAADGSCGSGCGGGCCGAGCGKKELAFDPAGEKGFDAETLNALGTTQFAELKSSVEQILAERKNVPVIRPILGDTEPKV